MNSTKRIVMLAALIGWAGLRLLAQPLPEEDERDGYSVEQVHFQTYAGFYLAPRLALFPGL